MWNRKVLYHSRWPRVDKLNSISLIWSHESTGGATRRLKWAVHTPPLIQKLLQWFSDLSVNGSYKTWLCRPKSCKSTCLLTPSLPIKELQQHPIVHHSRQSLVHRCSTSLWPSELYNFCTRWFILAKSPPPLYFAASSATAWEGV